MKRYRSHSFAGIGIILYIILLVCGVGLSFASSPTEDSISKTEILVSGVNRVSGDSFLLGEVADIIASDKTTATYLEEIPLGISPKPGKSRTWSGNKIRSLILAAVPNINDSDITVPSRVMVTRTSQKASVDLLKRLFKEKVLEVNSGQSVQVTRLSVRGIRALPGGPLELESGEFNGGKNKGRLTLTFVPVVDGVEYRTISVSGWVDFFEQVVCAAVPIERGSIITPGDITIKTLNTSKMMSGVIYNTDDVIGKIAKRRIKIGAGITSGIIDTPPVIRNGDRVKIVASSGGLKVVTLGMAKQKGSMGAQIRVLNITSGRVITGRVVSPSVVEVLF